ncbi:hypothetical protein SAMN02745165_00277 [Malonomonas rubra DSM 5091]|uniref:Uncharacterized protein n=1 Tax=Malonomonas rubra DSM 5091 TaxID=1122189 RepID=A0A1M6BRK9_MALRU|nr:hypothetical protein [Malonomonas rubra]SHI51395.1 hypothetical protein SAMN02745165_00277 [Malonomonas rubra DSM 5091]
MGKILAIAGNILGGVGLLLCVVAGFARLSGNYYVFSYEAMTVFNAGVGVMVAACLAKLQQLTSTP